MSRTMPCPVCWGARLICEHCASSGQVEDVRLSAHFRISEMLRSTRAQVDRIANAPTAAAVHRMQELCADLLEPIRAELGPLTITSGYRSARLNAAVGGSSTSAHLSGWGADVRPRDCAPEAIMEHLAASDLMWDQAILYGSHVHLGLRRPATGEQRRQLLHAGTWRTWEPQERSIA